MSIRNFTAWLLVLMVMALLCSTAGGQQTAVNATKAFIIVPGIILHPFTALGSRVKTVGKEKTTYTGKFIDASSNSSNARVIYQLPDLVRLEGFKGNGPALSFNGKVASGIASQASDESMLETFVMDFPEGMLESVQESSAIRLLGRGFGPDPNVVPNYTGTRYDIYEITGPVRCGQSELIRTKTYYFDSQTGYLQSTRYYDRSISPPMKIETRFSMWGTIDGSAYPAQIERYQGGKRVFSFIATAIDNGPAVDAGNF